MRKRLLSILTLIGIALDIRDMAGLIRWAFISLGGSWVLTGGLWATIDIPWPALILIAGGLFLILLPVLPGLWKSIWSRRREPPVAQPEQLTQPYLRGLSVRVADLAREEDVISDRTFED